MNRSVRYRRTRLNSSFHLWQDEPSNTGVYIRVSVIASATKQVASLSIKTAVNEAKTELGSDEIDVCVDDTWQKRKYSSRNGVVKCLSNLGKYKGSRVVDTEVLTT